ncbi:uncharacterized protein LOC144288048 [Canis aureus]
MPSKTPGAVMAPSDQIPDGKSVSGRKDRQWALIHRGQRKRVDLELKLPSLTAVAKQGMFSILEAQERDFRPTCGDNKVSRPPTLGFQGGVRIYLFVEGLLWAGETPQTPVTTALMSHGRARRHSNTPPLELVL